MTKNELADRVAQRIGIAAEQVRQALDASFDAVADELASGGEVALAGFGKFSVSHRSARQGRSPATGETIQIKAKRVVKFRVAKAAGAWSDWRTSKSFPVVKLVLIVQLWIGPYLC